MYTSSRRILSVYSVRVSIIKLSNNLNIYIYKQVYNCDAALVFFSEPCGKT